MGEIIHEAPLQRVETTSPSLSPLGRSLLSASPRSLLPPLAIRSLRISLVLPLRGRP